jgi:hypothetical protein
LPAALFKNLPKNVNTKSIHAKTVFPDVVVHKRGNQGDNLLVLEIKKASSPATGTKYDYVKLNGFIDCFNYVFAVHLVIDAPENGKLRGTLHCWSKEKNGGVKSWELAPP